MLCATSLQAVHTDTLAADAGEQPAQNGWELSERIYDDMQTLLKKVHKDTTSLSLAMRPSAGREADADASPVAGLDDASIKAATAMLQALASDSVPKLVFLANLAHKHRAFYVPDPRAAEQAVAVAEADPAVQLAKAMGGQVVLGDQAARGAKDVRASTGELFARELRDSVSRVIELVAQLCKSFMDPRTREALDRAQQRRDQGTGARARSEADRAPRGSRGLSLSLTKQLWELTDSLAGSTEHTPAHISRLPRNNREALLKVWKQSELMLHDGLEELRTSCEEQGGEEEPAPASDDLAAQWSASVSLSPEEAVQARHALALLERGEVLQRAVRRIVVGAQSPAHLDLDLVGNAVKEMVESQDDLVAAVLYGEEEEEEEEEEGEGDGAGEQDDAEKGTGVQVGAATDAGAALETVDQGDAIREARTRFAAACAALARAAEHESIDTSEVERLAGEVRAAVDQA